MHSHSHTDKKRAGYMFVEGIMERPRCNVELFACRSEDVGREKLGNEFRSSIPHVPRLVTDNR